MEPSWHQNRIPNRCQLRKAFFHETHSRCSGGSFCRTKRVEVEVKNRSKINQKIDSKMECILASIFNRFWSILDAKLGEEIDPKSIKKAIEKTTPKTTRTRWPKNANKAPRRFSTPPMWSSGEGIPLKWRADPSPPGVWLQIRPSPSRLAKIFNACFN